MEKVTFFINLTQTHHLGNYQQHQALPGGDINAVYRVTTDKSSVVVKVNHATKFPNMFQREAKGLALLANADALKTPFVLGMGQIEQQAYLILEDLGKGTPSDSFWADFGRGLAKLHQQTATTFGLSHDNYIGSLPQYNQTEITSASTFYIEKRLQPQFELAAKNGFRFRGLTDFYQQIQNIIPDEAPALIHGDLWSGNYHIDENGLPCLIDPAVSYAPREMDIAMMKLFGGYPNEVFQVYHHFFPLAANWESRIQLWQLYYLLVHLNLFGEAYLGSVRRIIQHYR